MSSGDRPRREAARGRWRAELREFLRSRRERLTPAAAGLPETGRRRTNAVRRLSWRSTSAWAARCIRSASTSPAGLRREEVAVSAGVCLVSYFTNARFRVLNQHWERIAPDIVAGSGPA
ncbi:hypothetical protein AB0M34_00910 [Nocardia sp. NPDC050193]